MRENYLNEMSEEFIKNEIYADVFVKLARYKEVMFEWAHSFMEKLCKEYTFTRDNHDLIFNNAPINNHHELFVLRAFYWDTKFWDTDLCRWTMVFNFEALKENFDEVIKNSFAMQERALLAGSDDWDYIIMKSYEGRMIKGDDS